MPFRLSEYSRLHQGSLAHLPRNVVVRVVLRNLSQQEAQHADAHFAVEFCCDATLPGRLRRPRLRRPLGQGGHQTENQIREEADFEEIVVVNM